MELKMLVVIIKAHYLAKYEKIGLKVWVGKAKTLILKKI